MIKECVHVLKLGGSIDGKCGCNLICLLCWRVGPSEVTGCGLLTKALNSPIRGPCHILHFELLDIFLPYIPPFYSFIF